MDSSKLLFAAPPLNPKQGFYKKNPPLRQQPCAGLVVLEMVPSLSVCGLQPLAQAAADVAQALGLQEVATELAVPDSLRNSCRELGAVCGSSLDNAVYT
eukprot:1150264-Pelagomonas_calceolata.AAC.2